MDAITTIAATACGWPEGASKPGYVHGMTDDLGSMWSAIRFTSTT